MKTNTQTTTSGDTNTLKMARAHATKIGIYLDNIITFMCVIFLSIVVEQIYTTWVTPIPKNPKYSKRVKSSTQATTWEDTNT